MHIAADAPVASMPHILRDSTTYVYFTLKRNHAYIQPDTDFTAHAMPIMI